MKIKTYLIISYFFFSVIVFTQCINTDPGESHTNPMDSLYESNGYRIQLFIEKNSSKLEVKWSSIYTDNGERDDSQIKSIETSELHWVSGLPSSSEIEDVKNLIFTGTSQAIDIKYEDTDGFAGSAKITDPGTKQSYIIRIVLKDSKDNSKVVYSNFYVWEP